ncbi:HD family phosphohydrolase [Spirochaetia bacterium]|nr:HD family phosphohydrolase [Spirochaetia bacterium]
MNNDLSEKVSEYIQKMPSLPTSVAKVLEVCNNPLLSPADLNYVISLDPVLVGRVLKLVNSAYYALDKRVTSLVRAIIMLGLNTVKNLALSSAVMGQLVTGRDPKGLNMEGFWRHSLCVGVTAKLLAQKRGINPKLVEEYFTCGLLHDLGKIPLNTILSKKYLDTVARADELQTSFYKAEENMLGTDHCVLGGLIVNSWRLEGAVGDVIIQHHQCGSYQGSYKDILYTVAVANWFASIKEIGFSGSRYPENPSYEIWGALGVKQEILSELVPTINKEIEKAKIFLRV